MLITRTPHRISFGGGGTDLEDYFLKRSGAVISIAIGRYFYATIEKRNDDKIRIASADFKKTESFEDLEKIDLNCDFKIPLAVLKQFSLKGVNLFLANEVPPGTGLGSSCAVSVGLVHLISSFCGFELSRAEIAEKAFFIDTRILKFPIGKQDQYASSFGGLNFIEFTCDGVTVEPVQLRDDTLKKLENRVLLFFSGKTRKASSVLRIQRESCRAGNAKVMSSLDDLKELAYEMRGVLIEDDLALFGELLHRSWLRKRELTKNVSNEHIDSTYEFARKNGAIGGKIAGAGGGGFLLLYCKEGARDRIISSMKTKGWERFDFSFDFEGTKLLRE